MRKKLSRLELKECSTHLAYEYDMFRETFALISGGSLRMLSTIVRNSLLESYLLHARNLDDFFACKENNYLMRSHYISEEISKPLNKDQRKKINNKISHLTTIRVHGEGNEIGDIYKAVNDAMAAFLSLCPQELLCESLSEFADFVSREKIDLKKEAA